MERISTHGRGRGDSSFASPPSDSSLSRCLGISRHKASTIGTFHNEDGLFRICRRYLEQAGITGVKTKGKRNGSDFTSGHDGSHRMNPKLHPMLNIPSATA